MSEEETEIVLPSKSTPRQKRQPEEPPGTYWEGLFLVLGLFAILGSIVLFLSGSAQGFFICLGVSLQMFFTGFIVKVLTDMRWCLLRLATKNE